MAEHNSIHKIQLTTSIGWAFRIYPRHTPDIVFSMTRVYRGLLEKLTPDYQYSCYLMNFNNLTAQQSKYKKLQVKGLFKQI